MGAALILWGAGKIALGIIGEPETAIITHIRREGGVHIFEPITLAVAKPKKELKCWRAYASQYHMLGDKWVFGSRLQYFIKSSNIELVRMQFSASEKPNCSQKDIYIYPLHNTLMLASKEKDHTRRWMVLFSHKIDKMVAVL